MRKVIKVCVIILLCILVLIGIVTLTPQRKITRADFDITSVVVKRGESPWSIAERYCPEELDIRKYLQWCADENGLHDWNTYIQAGDEIIFLKLK